MTTIQNKKCQEKQIFYIEYLMKNPKKEETYKKLIFAFKKEFKTSPKDARNQLDRTMELGLIKRIRQGKYQLPKRKSKGVERWGTVDYYREIVKTYPDISMDSIKALSKQPGFIEAIKKEDIKAFMTGHLSDGYIKHLSTGGRKRNKRWIIVHWTNKALRESIALFHTFVVDLSLDPSFKSAQRAKNKKEEWNENCESIAFACFPAYAIMTGLRFVSDKYSMKIPRDLRFYLGQSILNIEHYLIPVLNGFPSEKAFRDFIDRAVDNQDPRLFRYITYNEVLFFKADLHFLCDKEKEIGKP